MIRYSTICMYKSLRLVNYFHFSSRRGLIKHIFCNFTFRILLYIYTFISYISLIQDVAVWKKISKGECDFLTMVLRGVSKKYWCCIPSQLMRHETIVTKSYHERKFASFYHFVLYILLLMFYAGFSSNNAFPCFL